MGKALDEYVAAAREAGAVWARAVPASYVVTAAWVRFKCQFGCSGYDNGRYCPPRTPTPAETATAAPIAQSDGSIGQRMVARTMIDVPRPARMPMPPE